MLGKQLDEIQAGKQELVAKYEEQLQHVKDEVRSAFILAIAFVLHKIVTYTIFISNMQYDLILKKIFIFYHYKS